MSAAGKKRPLPLAEPPLPNKRRSLSTTSRDTTAVNSPIEPAPAQYAPIGTTSYPQSTEAAAIATPTDSQLSGDHAQLAQVRQFNNSYSGSIGPTPKATGGAPEKAVDSGRSHQGSAYQLNGHSQPAQSSYTAQNPSLTRTMSLDGAGGNGTDEEKKSRKIASNNAANEKELRELIESNGHRALESIARDVRSAERTQKAEKAKQLFAMRWLQQYCRRDNESVPRARVYTYYAQRCGNDRVDTLNPASFGKLVRIIFPGIQTRRLGVRGESKYHYVNLGLVEDPQPGSARPMSAHMSIGSGRGTPVEPDASLANSSRMPVDSAAFPSHEQIYSQPQIQVSTNPASQGYLFAEPTSTSSGIGRETRTMYNQSLCFSHLNDRPSSDEPLDMPDITHYISSGFDRDLSEALSALYKAHCTSLVDAVRYVKEKQFIKLIGSFNGTMTVPVAKLFQQSSIAPWIRECDRVMYQQIIKFVSQLVLQVLPQPVYLMLRTISMDLTEHITKHFRQYPDHVLQSKLEMATIFSSLLQRLLRVNETAHAAANLLMKDNMRCIMWQDWVNSVKPKRVVESALSRCGHEEAHAVLTADMRLLLAPLPAPEALDEPPEYRAAAAQLDIEDLDWSLYATADTIMERWSAFLKRLPSRFPDVPTRNLLHCIESVGNAALRDVTVSVAQSFGAWWTTKVWIDEYMLWLAEMGGFLDSRTPEPSPTHAHSFQDYDSTFADDLRHSTRADEISRPGTATELPRPSSAHPALDFGGLHSFSPQMNGQRHSSGPPTATFKYHATPRADKHVNGASDSFEDSGIGLSLLAEGPGGFVGFSPWKPGTVPPTGFTPVKGGVGG